MPIAVFTGLPGAGKSQKMAHTIVSVLYRNKKWFDKSGIRRLIYSNLKLQKPVEEEFEGFIKYWSEPAELVKLRDCDVFWDEIATHLDSTQWANMSLEIKRWLQQHRKFGIEIFGTTQDFGMIDKSMRRLTSDLLILSKMFGSRDRSSTKPDVKRIWGLVMVKTLDPAQYDDSGNNQVSTGLPSFMFLTRVGVDLYDTTQEIKAGKYPPLNHIERECITDGCTFHKVDHR